MSPQTPFGPQLTAMATPFASDGAVDFRRAEELTERLLSTGTTGLVVSGTTGESPTLTPEEKLELFVRVKSAAGGAPVIANTGDNETAFSIELSQRAEEAGVDAILLVVPYYSKPSQEGLYQHFKAIAGSVKLPCLLYNVPGRTSKNLDSPTLGRLSEISNIVGVKESSGDPVQWARYRNAVPDEFLIYSGNDADALPMMPLGACGLVSVISHIAGEPMRRVMDAYWAGDTATALREHLRLLPVVDALFPASCPSPAPVKAGLQMQGFDCGGLRLPLVEANEQERENLRLAMQYAELL